MYMWFCSLACVKVTQWCSEFVSWGHEAEVKIITASSYVKTAFVLNFYSSLSLKVRLDCVRTCSKMLTNQHQPT